MAHLRLAPTRSNLLRIRESLQFAREGHEILDKKREVLTTELMHVAHDAATMQARVWKMLAEAYQALEMARLAMGRERLEWTSLAVTETVEVEITPHSVMGVVVPSIEAYGEPPEVSYGLGDTSVVLDDAVMRFRRVLEEIPTLAELMTTVLRLASELQKTQRRVNALQHVFIPQYEETVAHIESVLEEREREETFRLKRLKSQAARAAVGPTAREYEQPYRDLGGGKVTSTEFG